MEFEEDPENNVPRSGSFSGAIFMCNRTTIKECFQRKLFGLPPPQINFVKKVKAGMILFLFEYEERKLYGVFQATSDGAVNIVPQAFKSSGKQVPAQIRFKKIWNCNPLYEPDFRDALRDNYYTARKFQYGLSEDQVQELLLLFSTRKLYQRQKNPVTHANSRNSRKQSRKSGLGRIRVTDEGKCLTRNSAETVVGMHNDTLSLTKYPEFPGSKLTTHSENYDKLIIQREDYIEEDQRRSSPVAPYSMQPQIHNFGSTPQDNQHVAIPSGNPYRSRLLFPFRMDHNSPAQVHTPADSLLQHSRGQLIPSHFEPENMSSFPARHNLDVANNLGDYIPLDSHDIPSQVHALADGLFHHSGGQLIASQIEQEKFSGSSQRHNLNADNNLGDYIPLNCNDDSEPCSTDIIFPETDYFGNKSIAYNDFERYNELSFHEPPLDTMPFSRNENYERENIYPPFFGSSSGKGTSLVPYHGFPAASQCNDNCEGMQHWNYEPSTAAMSVLSERKFQPCESLHPLESRGAKPDAVIDHKDYRGHLGRQYDTQNTRTNDCHEDYGDQLGLQYDSQNTRTSDSDEYYRSPLGMYSDIQRASVFSRLAVPQETITGDDDESMDEVDTVDLSVDQLMELLQQNKKSWWKSSKKSQQFTGPCNDYNHFKEVKETEMNEDAFLVNEEDKASERRPEDVTVVNFKRRSAVRKARGETEGGGAKGMDSESLSGTPCKRRKLIRPSFRTIITEDKENGGTSEALLINDRNEKVFSQNIQSEGNNDKVENGGTSEALLIDDRNEKVFSQNIQSEGNNDKVGIHLAGKDFKGEVSVPKELGATDYSSNVQVLFQDTPVTTKAQQMLVDSSLKSEGKQNPEEFCLESKTVQFDTSIGKTDCRDQAREIGDDETTAISAGVGDFVSETEQKVLLLRPSTCETKEQ